ncbi:MAG: InlB B-repeat-containing protein, partial [Spirochaetales bacterium]|nr:InlB B-repeat-containing protein [Spirochaetales bacterium]
MKRFNYLIMTFLVIVSFWLIGCQNETTQSVEGSSQGTNGTDKTKITSLQVAIDQAQEGDIIDAAQYTGITRYEATVNRAVTIRNFPDLKGEQLTVSTSGVVLDNIHSVKVTSSSSLKISGSSLSSLSIAPSSPQQSLYYGRGDSSSAKPPKIDVSDTHIASDVSISYAGASLTVSDLSADKIKFLADNTQLTIEDSSSSIGNFTTNNICQVILEDGTSDSIPCSENKMSLGANAKLTQVNMQAAEELILVELSLKSSLRTTIVKDQSIDFSNIMVTGTYMAQGAVTVFTAALTYEMQSTFSRHEENFTIKIGGGIVYKDGSANTEFDWTKLSVGSHDGQILSDFPSKGSNYAYNFTVTVVDVAATLIELQPNASDMKTSYLAGESLDISGLIIDGKYRIGDLAQNDYTTALSSDKYTLTPAAGTVLDTSVTSITVTSNENNDVTATIPIKVHPSCIVTFEPAYKGNTGKSWTVRVKKDTPVQRPADPARFGWTFVQWCPTESRNTSYNFNTNVSGTITLYAKWTKDLPKVGSIAYQDSTASATDKYIFVSEPIENQTALGVVFDYNESTQIAKIVNLDEKTYYNKDTENCPGVVYCTDTQSSSNRFAVNILSSSGVDKS